MSDDVELLKRVYGLFRKNRGQERSPIPFASKTGRRFVCPQFSPILMITAVVALYWLM